MKSRRLIRTALMATAMLGVASCVLTGCGKEEAVSVDQTAPEVRMKDSVYRAQLDESRKEMKDAVVVRNDIGRRMAEMVDKAKEKLKTEDMAKVNEYLAKKPKWNELKKLRKAAEADFEAKRQKALATVRKRLNKKEPISK